MSRTTTMQRFGDLKPVQLALPDTVRKASIIDLNRTLADAIVLRDLYEKHHWQVSGPTFYQLHLLFDVHQGQLGDGTTKSRSTPVQIASGVEPGEHVALKDPTEAAKKK